MKFSHGLVLGSSSFDIKKIRFKILKIVLMKIAFILMKNNEILHVCIQFIHYQF